jgi:hypothetical protein
VSVKSGDGAEPAVAQIQLAEVEYVGFFSEPLAEFSSEAIAARFLLQLLPLGVRLSDISASRAGHSFADLAVVAQLPRFGAKVRIGLDKVTVNFVQPDWSRRDQLFDIAEHAAATADEFSKPPRSQQVLTLTMHVLSHEPRRLLMDRVVRLTDAFGLPSPNMLGVSAYWDDWTFVIDSSAVIEGGFFVRIQRTHCGDSRIREMATRLYDDENLVLGLLGMKVA